MPRAVAAEPDVPAGLRVVSQAAAAGLDGLLAGPGEPVAARDVPWGEVAVAEPDVLAVERDGPRDVVAAWGAPAVERGGQRV